MHVSSTAATYIVLMRPQQWTKNLLVFAAPLFAAQAHIPAQRLRALFLFAAFCLVSSAVYIFNDILDRHSDQAHPRKRRRPLASGSVSVARGAGFALALLACGLSLTWPLVAEAKYCLLGYLALQGAYSLFLKHQVILDVMAVSAGFVLRAAAGAYAIDVAISPWLLICTILLSLFLVLSKRRSEILSSNDARAHRSVLSEYTIPFLDQLIAIVTAGTILAYILYVYSDQTMHKFPSRLMPLTLPFVLYGIFRYLYLIYRKAEGGEPELLLVKDLPLLIDIVLWAGSVAIIASIG